MQQLLQVGGAPGSSQLQVVAPVAQAAWACGLTALLLLLLLLLCWPGACWSSLLSCARGMQVLAGLLVAPGEQTPQAHSAAEHPRLLLLVPPVPPLPLLQARVLPAGGQGRHAALERLLLQGAGPGPGACPWASF
jgi:hypothetical protein